MSRLTDAAAEEPRFMRKGPACGVPRLADSFEDEADKAFFWGLLDEIRAGKRTAASVARILSRLGISYSANNISYHLRGQCSCTPPPPQE